MERNIIKIDEAGLKDDLKTLIRGTVEDTLNARRGGGRPLQCRKARTLRRPQELPQRPLPQETAHGCGRARHRRPETAPGPVLDSHHRVLPTQGIVRPWRSLQSSINRGGPLGSCARSSRRPDYIELVDSTIRPCAKKMFAIYP